MQVKDIPQIAQLSTPEKILFLEDLWDEISKDEDNIPVPESHVKELEARYNDFKSNPGSLLSLEELQNRINKRK